MGSTYSHLEKEMFTWKYHCLLFDEMTRETNLKVVEKYFPNDTKIQIASQDVCYGGLNYQHFFISDTKAAHFMELSSLEQNSEELYDLFRVQCNTLPHTKFLVDVDASGKPKTTLVTPEIKERMIQMLGMCNYSLCLRNSEHVANYIFYGSWTSFQMEEDGCLLKYFRSTMTEDQHKRINLFPSSISPKTVGGGCGTKLYAMIDQQYTPTKFQYFSDADEESYNILVVGKA